MTPEFGCWRFNLVCALPSRSLYGSTFFRAASAMNPHCHHTWTAKSSPTEISDCGVIQGTVPELFGIELRYRPGGEPERYSCVHIPKTLQPALASGEVKTVYIETLGFGSLASRCLPNSPEFVVLGVETREGEKLTEVPKALKMAKRICLVTGTASCAIGAALLVSSQAWLGAIALVLGTHCWRTALQVPGPVVIKDTKLPPDGPVLVAFPVKNS
jgi:hypothetical protein